MTCNVIGAAALSALLVSAANADTATIAYWPFGENGFSDVSGNGHDLTSTTVTESDAGYITLDGTSQFLTTASALDLSGETGCHVRVLDSFHRQEKLFRGPLFRALAGWHLGRQLRPVLHGPSAIAVRHGNRLAARLHRIVNRHG